MKASVDDADRAHQKFFRNAGFFAMRTAGFGGGAFAAGLAVHAGARSAADRARELARYDLGGLSEAEKAEASAAANDISARYPSVSRTDVLGHIRQLRARLGSFDHAMENVEALTKAQVVLKTLGNSEHAGEDLEKLVLGLESQGIGAQPAKFASYLNAFVKAKSLFPDLGGEDFRQYMQRANASKYGLNDDYLTSVVPTMLQHEGASNFGNMQASAFSALVGGRQSKAAKAAMRAYGLLDDSGHLKGEARFIANPYEWATKNLAPALQAKGVQIDEEHRGDVVKALTQMFSNRKVGEFFAAQLVNSAIIEKDRELLRHAKGTEAADQMRGEDPYVALGGLTTQMKDAATAFIAMRPVVDAMNKAATSFANIAKTFESGKVPENTNLGHIIKGWHEPVADVNERVRLETLQAQQREVDKKLKDGGYGEALTRQFRMKSFELQQQINQAENAGTMPAIYSDEEAARWFPGVVPTPLSDPRKARRFVPMPLSDPRRGGEGDMPPVQSLEGGKVQAELSGSADVKGSVDVNVKVEAGSSLIAIEESVKSLLAHVTGLLKANGPGSAGRSSPDAAAPPPSGRANGPGY